MDLKLTQQKAEWNHHELNEKMLLCVEFPNTISTTTGKSFKWMPTYRQLEQIKKELDIVEKQWKAKKQQKIDERKVL